MVNVNHTFVEQTTEQTHTGDLVYTDITGAEITSGNFIAGKKYLIVTNAQIGGSSEAEAYGIQTLHGSTAFAESEYVFEADDNIASNEYMKSYTWFTVWTAITSEGIKLQFKTFGSGETVKADQITMTAIELTEFTENTDWLFDFNTTNTALTTTFSASNNASLTFTPAEASDWLVLSYDTIEPPDTDQYESRLETTGGITSSQPTTSVEGETATGSGEQDKFNDFITRAFSLTAVSHTFTMQARNINGSSGTRTNSAMFAINLDKFRNHSFAYTEAGVAGTGGTSEVQTTSITPATTKDHWVGSFFTFNPTSATSQTGARMQIDNVDQPPTQTSDNYFAIGVWDNMDLAPFFIQSIDSLNASAHNIDLDVFNTTTSLFYGNRLAFAVEMQTPSVDKNFTVDSLLQDTFDEVFTVDAILQATQTEVFLIDSFLQATQIKPFLIDALLQVTQQTETFLVDSIVVNRNAETFDVDAFTQAQQTFNFTVDGLREASPEKLYLIDAFLQETFVEDFEVDSFLQATFTKDFTVDVIVVDRNIEVFEVDAVLKATFIEDFLVDAFIQAEQVFNFLVDALPQDQFTKLFLIDSILQATFIEDFDVDSKLIVRKTIDFTVDADLQPQKLFCDFFNRPNSITLGASDIPGNLWIETETVPGVGPEIVSNKMGWLSVQNANNRNEPIAENTFTKQTSGKLKWQFQFDFDRGSDNDFRLTMQLGDGSLMVNPNISHTTGVAVNLQYASTSRGMTAQAGFGHGFEPSLVQVARTKGFLQVNITADFGSQTYIINISGSGFLNGTNVTTGIPFVNGVGIDTIRIYSDLLSAIAFNAKTFDDMCVFKVFETSESFTVDAILKATFTEDFTVDALLRKQQVFDFTVDSLLSQGFMRMFLIDAFIQRQGETEEFEIDAEIAIRVPENYNVDARLRLRATETFTVDSLLKAVQTEDFTVDALIAEIQTKDFTIDAFFEEAPQKLFTVDALLRQLGQTEGFTVDSRLAQINTETFTIDATNLFLTQTKGFTIDSLLRKDQTETFIVDSFVFDGQVKNVLVDSLLRKEQTKTFTIQAELSFTATEDFEVDSLLKEEGNVETFTVDAIFQVTKKFKVDVKVVRAGQASVNVLLKGQNTKDFTVNALVFIPPARLICVQAILVDRNIEDFTIDSILVNRFEETFTVDTLLPEVNTITFIVDTFTAQPNTEIFTVNSILKSINTETFDVGLLLKGAVTKTFTVDTFSSITKTKTFAVSVVIKANAQTKTFTIDTFSEALATKTFTIDAVFPRTQFNNKKYDALIQQLGVTTTFIVGAKTRGKVTKTFNLDAVLEATFTKSFIIDGFPFIPPAISITVDPILLFTAIETADVDSKLINRKDTTFDIDAVLAVTVTNTEDFIVDATLLGLANTKTFKIDSIISTRTEVTFIVDTFTGASFIKTVFVDSILFDINAETFLIDSILFGNTFTETFNVDASLRGVKTKGFKIDSNLSKERIETFTIDGIRFIPPARVLLVDSLVKKFNQLEPFTVEAHIRVRNIEIFDINSILSSVNSETTFVDALLLDVFIEDFIIDAVLVRKEDFTVDAFIESLGENCSFTSIFSDSIPNDSGWIISSGRVQIDQPGFTPNKIELVDFNDGGDENYHKFIPKPVDSNSSFTLNFEYKETDNSVGIGDGSPGPWIMALSDDDVIIETGDNFFGIASARIGANMQYNLQMGDSSTTIVTGSIIIPQNQTVFVTAEKTGSQVRLRVYSDPARTIHLSGSPTPYEDVSVLGQATYERVKSSSRNGPNKRAVSGTIDEIIVIGNGCTNFTIDTFTQDIPGEQFLVDARLTGRNQFTVSAFLKAIGSNRCDISNIFEDNFLTITTWSNEINNTTVDGWGNQRIFIDGESTSSEELLDPSDTSSLNGFVRGVLKPGGFAPFQTPIFKTKHRRKLLADFGGIGRITGNKFRVEFEFEHLQNGAGGTPIAFNQSGNHAQDDQGPQLAFQYAGGASLQLILRDGNTSIGTGGLNLSTGTRIFVVGDVNGESMTLTYYNDAEHTSIFAGPKFVNVSTIQKNSLNLTWAILQSNSKFSGPSNPSIVNRLDNLKIFSSPCPMFGIDAHILFNPIREFTVGAVIVRIEEFSINASILDPTVVNVSEFKISSILSGSILKEFTINGLLAKTKTKDVIINGIIIRGATFSVSAVFSTIPQDLNFSLTHMQDITPLFSGIFDKIFSLDALLSGRIGFTVDARLRLVKRFDIDAFLTTPSTPLNFSLAHMQDIVPIFNMDVILPFFVDALISTPEIQTFIIDGNTFFVQIEDYIVDAIIAVPPTNIILMDTNALLKKVFIKDTIVDSILVNVRIKTFTVDTFSIGIDEKTFTVNSLIKKIGDFKQFEINARIISIEIKDTTVDAILLFSGDNGFCTIFPSTNVIGTGLEQFTGPVTPEHESGVDLLMGQEFTLNNQQVRRITVLLRASDFPNEIDGNPPPDASYSTLRGEIWNNVIKGNNSGETSIDISTNVIEADKDSGDLPPGVWTEVTFDFTGGPSPVPPPFLTGNFLIGVRHNVGIGVVDPQGVGVAKPVISDSNVIPGEALFRRDSNTSLPLSDQWQELVGTAKDMVIDIEVLNGDDIILGKGTGCIVSDSIVVNRFVQDFIINAVLVNRFEETPVIDSLLKGTLTNQALVDSLIANDFVTNGGPAITKYYLTDSVLKATFIETFTIDVFLGEFTQNDKTFNIDAQILLDNERIRIDAFIRKTDIIKIFPDALLSSRKDIDYKVNVLLKGVQNKEFTIGALTVTGVIFPFFIDARIAQPQTLDYFVNAIIGGGFNFTEFIVDGSIGTQRSILTNTILKALGDGVIGTGNNGGTNDFAENPLVDQQNGGNFFQLPLGTLVGQRLRLPTAPVRVTDYTFIMFRSNTSGSPTGTITGKIYKQSIAGNPILVGDLIATSDNVINVADLTTNPTAQFVTFTFTNPPEITQDDNIFIGFEISGSNENTFIETELTGTVIDGGDLNVEFTAGIWGADLGVDTKVIINIDEVPRQRASALMSAFVGRFPVFATVNALLIQGDATETFRVSAKLTGLIQKEFTIGAILRGKSFCISAFVGDVFEIVIDCESVISGKTSGVSTI